MSVRLGTFNIENLLSRFDFSGYRNELHQDRALRLFDIRSEAEFQRLEEARLIASTDDMRQLTALAIADMDADILCLQEVDNIEALKAFEYGYLFRMIGEGCRQKYLMEGNDSRGIDVALMMRGETRTGEPIELVDIKSHARLTYADLDLFTPELAALDYKPQDRIFKRDCLEADLSIGGARFTLYVVHFKSMNGGRNGQDGRSASAPVRLAEARAVRQIISRRFGTSPASRANYAICGDMNDYGEKLQVGGDKRNGFTFSHVVEPGSVVDVFAAGGFAENVVARRPELDRWTHFHQRGPSERHLSQLDYIWISPHLAASNRSTMPEIIRAGQPYRTIFPPGQTVERYPRVGWDRPKSSDHCPVVIELDLVK
jgi:predicted extracellular nuclease